jgi:hypothetical protein
VQETSPEATPEKVLIDALRLVATGLVEPASKEIARPENADDRDDDIAELQRLQAIAELMAVLAYFPAVGIARRLLPGLETLKLALIDVNRGRHHPMFRRRGGQPGQGPLGLEITFDRSTAAALMSFLMERGAAEDDAADRVAKTFRRCGMRIRPPALSKYRDRISSSREIPEARHQPSEVLGRRRYQTVLRFLREHFQNGAAAGLNEQEALEIAFDQVMRVVGPDPALAGGLSTSAQNILRRRAQSPD